MGGGPNWAWAAAAAPEQAAAAKTKEEAGPAAADAVGQRRKSRDIAIGRLPMVNCNGRKRGKWSELLAGRGVLGRARPSIDAICSRR